MEQSKTSSQSAALTLTVLAALARLVPHPPNFAPIGAAALFGGARLRGWQAYAVPLLAMLVTDPILNWMHGVHTLSVMTLVIYGCFLVNVVLGRAFLRKTNSIPRIATVAVLGSLQFFVITNFFVWLGARDIYPPTSSGLVACYIAAIPFFAWTVLGDLLYSGVLFTVYALYTRRLTAASSGQHA
ncbi:MAG TPA: DUF6580 family putative transport protein [Bryobacteraceae bacterium]|jgi:hypothetical protein|nr:DUF6580 family putative transport protein [Bryobacteraceae bacterium]